MKTMMMMVAVTIVAMTGCKSIEVDRRGQKLATDKNGEVVKTAAGEPLVLDTGWKVDYFQHWNWQKFDDLEAKAGEASLKVNNYQSGADTNLVALVDKSITGLGELATKVAAAYAVIAGGGAQADTVASLAARAVKLFADKGGNLSAAKVTSDGSGVTVSDGTVGVRCANGQCSDCSDGSCSDR